MKLPKVLNTEVGALKTDCLGSRLCPPSSCVSWVNSPPSVCHSFLIWQMSRTTVSNQGTVKSKARQAKSSWSHSKQILAVFHWYVVNEFELVRWMRPKKKLLVFWKGRWILCFICFLNHLLGLLEYKNTFPWRCVWKVRKRAEERSGCVLVPSLL